MRRLIAFVFPQRLGRVDYLWRILATGLALVVLSYTALVGYPPPMERLLKILGLLALCVYQFGFVLLPRVRDTGMSAWCVVLSVFPPVYVFLAIFLMFRGPEGVFRHGFPESAATT